jgi:N-acetylglucosaminyldiphosphoundecaprenol N-acetyl-beta-D-mannosaminyltransferase
MSREKLFGMHIDALRMLDVIQRLHSWIQYRGTCRYVVTPNVDHAVLYQEHPGLRRAYADASLVLVDGFPLLAAARFLRRQIPERVPGSDLVPALFESTNSAKIKNGTGDNSSLRVFLLGAGPGVAERAAANIHRQWSRVNVVGTYSPPLGFEHDPVENRAILSRIAACKPDVLVVGLGAPKQELWVHAHRFEIAAPVALCVGATIDFLAGEKQRAPVWMRRCGVEWLHRVISEPRRLAKRYLRDALIFPQLVWRELINGGGAVTPGRENADPWTGRSSTLPENV